MKDRTVYRVKFESSLLCVSAATSRPRTSPVADWHIEWPTSRRKFVHVDEVQPLIIWRHRSDLFAIYTAMSWIRNPSNKNQFEIWPSFPVENRNSVAGILPARTLWLRLGVSLSRAQAWWEGNVSQKQPTPIEFARSRARGSLDTIRLESKCKEPDLSLSELCRLGSVK